MTGQRPLDQQHLKLPDIPEDEKLKEMPADLVIEIFRSEIRRMHQILAARQKQLNGARRRLDQEMRNRAQYSVRKSELDAAKANMKEMRTAMTSMRMQLRDALVERHRLRTENQYLQSRILKLEESRIGDMARLKRKIVSLTIRMAERDAHIAELERELQERKVIALKQVIPGVRYAKSAKPFRAMDRIALEGLKHPFGWVLANLHMIPDPDDPETWLLKPSDAPDANAWNSLMLAVRFPYQFAYALFLYMAGIDKATVERLEVPVANTRVEKAEPTVLLAPKDIRNKVILQMQQEERKKLERRKKEREAEKEKSRDDNLEELDQMFNF